MNWFALLGIVGGLMAGWSAASFYWSPENQKGQYYVIWVRYKQRELVAKKRRK